METVRTENFLGNKKVIIGNKYSDLVLETLGKVYVKYGSNTRLINDLFKLLDNVSEGSDVSVKTVANQTELDALTYPGEGKFVFVKLSKTLYITLEGEYVPIVETGNNTGDYVSKSGDIMSGQLEIITEDAPLIVKSKELVENFNAEYLNGQTAEKFANKYKSERIKGTWTFEGANIALQDWLFKRGIAVGGDLVSASGFSSGFSGYGWMLDSTTNTLTVDNLIVRKLMSVYELVVNKISATNGSLWVTNAGKIESVYKINLAQPGKVTLAYSDTDPSGASFYNYTTFSEADITEKLGLSGNLFADSFLKQTRKLINDGISNYYLYLYYSYFSGSFYLIELDDEGTSYPPFEIGDIIRCQKFSNGEIKYYDAIVTNRLSANNTVYFIIQLSTSINDKYTNVTVAEDGTITRTNYINANSDSSVNTNVKEESDHGLVDTGVLAVPAEKDGIVQIGNIQNTARQNAIYITSSDNNAPYIDLLSGIDRPDYSVAKGEVIDGKVVYKTPLKTRLGRLDGLHDPALKTQPYGYGLYSDNVFLKGDFILQNGKDVMEFVDGEFITQLYGIASRKNIFKGSSGYGELLATSEGNITANIAELDVSNVNSPYYNRYFVNGTMAITGLPVVNNNSTFCIDYETINSELSISINGEVTVIPINSKGHYEKQITTLEGVNTIAISFSCTDKVYLSSIFYCKEKWNNPFWTASSTDNLENIYSSIRQTANDINLSISELQQAISDTHDYVNSQVAAVIADNYVTQGELPSLLATKNTILADYNEINNYLTSGTNPIVSDTGLWVDPYPTHLSNLTSDVTNAVNAINYYNSVLTTPDGNGVLPSKTPVIKTGTSAEGNYNYILSYYSDGRKALVDFLNKYLGVKVKNTGIDIQSGVITISSDKLVITDSSGQNAVPIKTFTENAVSGLDVSGVIRSNGFAIENIDQAKADAFNATYYPNGLPKQDLKFAIGPDGKLYARGAQISGNVDASSGKIGNLRISENGDLIGVINGVETVTISTTNIPPLAAMSTNEPFRSTFVEASPGFVLETQPYNGEVTGTVPVVLNVMYTPDEEGRVKYVEPSYDSIYLSTKMYLDEACTIWFSYRGGPDVSCTNEAISIWVKDSSGTIVQRYGGSDFSLQLPLGWVEMTVSLSWTPWTSGTEDETGNAYISLMTFKGNVWKKTAIAGNGLASMFGGNNYFLFTKDDGLSINTGSQGLKVNNTDGLKKLSDGSWVDVLNKKVLVLDYGTTGSLGLYNAAYSNVNYILSKRSDVTNITLPSNPGDGKVIQFRKDGSGNIVIIPFDGDTVNNSTSFTLSNTGSTLTLMYVQQKWYIN